MGALLNACGPFPLPFYKGLCQAGTWDAKCWLRTLGRSAWPRSEWWQEGGAL